MKCSFKCSFANIYEFFNHPIGKYSYLRLAKTPIDMKKSLSQILTGLVLILLAIFILIQLGVIPCPLQKQENSTEQQERDKAQRFKEAYEDNFRRTMDPALGYPPVERLLEARKQALRMQEELSASLSQRSDILAPRWRERGPNNIGGRTRTILIDRNDPSGNTIWAGGVSGGLWKTNDITAADPQWINIGDVLENLAIGAMAQDPNNPQILYVGTGEGYPNADAVRGIGILKSSDGGETWDILPATQNTTFRYTRGLLVHPQTGDVYAATSQGLYRSEDSGQNWTKVLGSGLGTSNDFYDILYASNGYLIASNNSAVFRSQTGNPNDWENLTSGQVSSMSRIEVTVCESNPDVMYLIGAQGGSASKVYYSNNGGQTWMERNRPEINGAEFTNGQAWYDLDIAVNPFEPNQVIAGGVPIMVSNDAGISWNIFATNMHVDQHKILFDPENPNVIYFGNDGGIYRSENGPVSSVQDKNLGYNVTQFYAGDLHPDTFSNYFLGGTQDNNSLQVEAEGSEPGPGYSVRGGDGFFAHIDQNQPQYQVVSSQYGNYSISTNEGASFGGGESFNGYFNCPSDYDDESNILYSQTFDGDFYRWHIPSGPKELVSFDANLTGFDISAITVDPNVPNRVYFGSFSPGKVIRVDNADQGSSVEVEVILSSVGTISSIAIEQGNPDHILVTFSNYGLVYNVQETTDGGQSWTNVEGNLPDMPVRWGMFNPNNPQQAMIATELGVWTTALLDGANTVWVPPMPDHGMPLVRTDMLRWRTSDNIVLAATHGRGFFTTDVFSPPTPRIEVPLIHYANMPLHFVGEASLNADSYAWDFGDGSTSTEANVWHTYTDVGTYQISLTINGNLTETKEIKILPEHSIPYLPDEPEYGGDIEGFTEQYGMYSVSGSEFVRGSSDFLYKDGTHSGDYAIVLAPDQEFYQPNTEAYFYLPLFDFSEEGLYEFSFWGKWRTQGGFDGFRVEYLTEGSDTWQPLGNDVSENWYNTHNTNLGNAGAFPQGSRYFSGEDPYFTRYSLNISELGGKGKVAFRFVFKSDNSVQYNGIVIDDIEISATLGELHTIVTLWDAAYNEASATLTWTTQPEYYCKEFHVERSINGKDFEEVEVIPATGGLTSAPQSYEYELLAQRDLYYFRLRVISENEESGLYEEFYTPVKVIRRRIEDLRTYLAFPNPFAQSFTISFTDAVNGPVQYVLYDTQGRRIWEGLETLDGQTYIDISPPNIAEGTYFLFLTIGEQEPEVIKLMVVR
ncbi:MAG TPA: PKD domain-containing protein [Phaeodactylibacter sp.]|nr:PKD domain-containing protein [Phaeodactylibacter sp.]